MRPRWKMVMDSPSPCPLLLGEGIQHFEKTRKGFGHAGWILNCDAIEAQADERECHCHTVVVICLDDGGTHPFAGMDGHAIFMLFHADTESFKFGTGRVDSISLFESCRCDAADSCRRISKRGDGGEGLGGVRDVAHVHVNAM